LAEMETDRHEKRNWPVLNKINTSFEIIVAHPDCQKEIICLRSNQSLAVVKAAVPMQTMFKLSWLAHRLTLTMNCRHSSSSTAPQLHTRNMDTMDTHSVATEMLHS